VGVNHEYDFSASDDGVLAYQSGNPNSRLAWLDRAGKLLEAVGAPADYAALALSPDGRRVVFSLLDADRRHGDLWLFDLARGTNSRLTFDPAGDGDPVWSPDGSRVAFSSNRETWHSNVYLRSTGGAGEDELLWQSEAEKFPTSWSRDGQFILFDNCEAKAKCGVWVQPLAGERQPRPYLHSTAFYQSSGQFSPDGKLVAYTSDESGRSEIYVRPFPTPGEKWQVSTAGGALPHWRADGRELFYLSGDDRLMAVDVRAGGGTFESGPPRALFQTNMKHGYGGYGYAVAPDGQRFLINTPVEPPGTAPLIIILNWTSGLRH
jgi:Tol biopolymer transport system component